MDDNNNQPSTTQSSIEPQVPVQQAGPLQSNVAAQQPTQPPVAMQANNDAGPQSNAASQASMTALLSPTLDAKIEEPEHPVSGGSPELGSVSAAVEAPVEEFIQLGETSPEIPEEVKEVGVEVTPQTENPDISNEVQQATGIEPAKDAVPVPTAPSGMVQLPNMPMDEVTAVQAMRTGKTNESRRWLATLVTFLFGQEKRGQGLQN